jgi:hypothetical protein
MNMNFTDSGAKRMHYDHTSVRDMKEYKKIICFSNITIFSE